MDHLPANTAAADTSVGAALGAAPPGRTGSAFALSGRQWVLLWSGIIALAWTASLISVFAGNAGHLTATLCLVVLLAAAAFDAAVSRIPNELTYPAIIIGLMLGCAVQLGGAVARFAGSAGASQALVGAAACGAIGLASMALAGMGGGDMKLLAAVGALLGATDAMTVLAYALAMAVVYAAGNLALRGRLNAALRSAAVSVLEMAYLGRPPDVHEAQSRTIPLAVPLLAGLALSRVVPRETVARWFGGMM